MPPRPPIPIRKRAPTRPWERANRIRPRHTRLLSHTLPNLHPAGRCEPNSTDNFVLSVCHVGSRLTYPTCHERTGPRDRANLTQPKGFREKKIGNTSKATRTPTRSQAITPPPPTSRPRRAAAAVVAVAPPDGEDPKASAFSSGPARRGNAIPAAAAQEEGPPLPPGPPAPQPPPTGSKP
jgi:hypothetical protein